MVSATKKPTGLTAFQPEILRSGLCLYLESWFVEPGLASLLTRRRSSLNKHWHLYLLIIRTIWAKAIISILHYYMTLPVHGGGGWSLNIITLLSKRWSWSILYSVWTDDWFLIIPNIYKGTLKAKKHSQILPRVRLLYCLVTDMLMCTFHQFFLQPKYFHFYEEIIGVKIFDQGVPVLNMSVT